MNEAIFAHELPLWAAIIVVFFLLIGCGLTLLGTIGLATFRNFYDRLHMPTLGTSWGIGGVLIASMLYHSLMQGRLVSHELLITIFLLVTTPVTLMMLARAAVHRDRSNDWRDLPPELFELYRVAENKPKEKEEETPPASPLPQKLEITSS